VEEEKEEEEEEEEEEKAKMSWTCMARLRNAMKGVLSDKWVAHFMHGLQIM
jgi:hypothetical protein